MVKRNHLDIVLEELYRLLGEDACFYSGSMVLEYNNNVASLVDRFIYNIPYSKRPGLTHTSFHDGTKDALQADKFTRQFDRHKIVPEIKAEHVVSVWKLGPLPMQREMPVEYKVNCALSPEEERPKVSDTHASKKVLLTYKFMYNVKQHWSLLRGDEKRNCIFMKLEGSSFKSVSHLSRAVLRYMVKTDDRNEEVKRRDARENSFKNNKQLKEVCSNGRGDVEATCELAKSTRYKATRTRTFDVWRRFVSAIGIEGKPEYLEQRVNMLLEMRFYDKYIRSGKEIYVPRNVTDFALKSIEKRINDL